MRKEEEMAEDAKHAQGGNGKRFFLTGMAGFVAGLIVMGALVYAVMPDMMIKTYQSPAGVEETVKTLNQAIEEEGWSSPGTMNMNKSMAKHGVEFEPKVRVVQLCHPDYASSVLQTDRYVASLMPCAFAVWEGEDGNTYVSKMNTGLMGKIFGGNIARVMGGHVAEDEHTMLKKVLNQ